MRLVFFVGGDNIRRVLFQEVGNALRGFPLLLVLSNRICHLRVIGQDKREEASHARELTQGKQKQTTTNKKSVAHTLTQHRCCPEASCVCAPRFR